MVKWNVHSYCTYYIQAPAIRQRKSVYFFFIKQHLLQCIDTNTCRHINIVLRRLKSPFILLKSDKNYDFIFLVKRHLFPYDFLGNYIICTIECTFHLTIDVQSFVKNLNIFENEMRY